MGRRLGFGEPQMVVATPAKAASPSCRRYAGASWSGNAFRSCCAVQAAVGCSVTATWTIRRRSCARMTSTKSILNVTVGTTKKSTAMIWLAWLVRNVRHVCDGGRGSRRMYLATVDWLTEMPNFWSSPCKRGAPQSGFAVDISQIRARMSRDTRRRPRSCRLFHVQNRRTPRRCHAMMDVAALARIIWDIAQIVERCHSEPLGHLVAVHQLLDEQLKKPRARHTFLSEKYLRPLLAESLRPKQQQFRLHFGLVALDNLAAVAT